MKTIKLREGKERSALRRHPWIFDSAIAKGSGDAGETVRVEANDGKFLGWASFSPESKIRARIWSFDEGQRIDASFFKASIARAIAARSRFDIQSNGVRLIHGESDGLPGLIVDRYDDILVASFLSCGTERWKAVIADELLAQTGLTKLYERSDSNVRKLEGLPEVTGWLRGEGATGVVLREHDWQLSLDVAEGHKTGFYLDQRDSRKKFADYAKRLQFQRVLNCYCYTGGFTVAALAGGAAHVTSIDSSGPAIELAKANVALNGFDAARTTMMDADVNASLRQFIQEGQTFDAILLDAPCTASGIVRRHPDIPWLRRASDLAGLAQQQKALLKALWPLLKPGGRLLYCTCSLFLQEGQVQIDSFLGNNTQARLLPSPGQLKPGKSANQAGVLDNDFRDHDGFFYALLERRLDA